MTNQPQDAKQKTDAAGGAEGGMAEGSAGGPSQGNTLKDLSDENVREMEKEDEPHAGRGDYG
jgi:hypothetical protein